MFLLIKTNARILDLRPVSDFPPCSSGRIPIQGDDKEHLDKHVGFDRWKCDIIHMGLLLVRPRITVFMAVVQNFHIIPVTFHPTGGILIRFVRICKQVDRLSGKPLVLFLSIRIIVRSLVVLSSGYLVDVKLCDFIRVGWCILKAAT